MKLMRLSSPSRVLPFDYLEPLWNLSLFILVAVYINSFYFILFYFILFYFLLNFNSSPILFIMFNILH